MLSKQEIEFIRSRIVSEFSPEKLILFGSQARNTADKYSDIDLLVISDLNENRRTLSLKIDRALKGLNYARDIIILTNKEFERDKTIPGTIARYAYQEGTLIYG